jgi:hypothetical protein
MVKRGLSWTAVALLAVACQPSIFIYEFELVAVSDVDVLNRAAELAAGYNLAFGDDVSFTCLGEEAFEMDMIDTVRPISWSIAGPYTDNGGEFNSGDPISRDWGIQLEVGGGPNCGSGDLIGEQAIRAGDKISYLKPGHVRNPTFRPSKAEIIARWEPFGAADTLKKVMQVQVDGGVMDNVTLGFDVRVCPDPLWITSDVSTSSTLSVSFAHVVKFEIEGEGSPCEEPPEDDE